MSPLEFHTAGTGTHPCLSSLLKMSPPHDYPCNTGLSLGLAGFEDAVNNELKVRKQTFMSFKFDHLLPSLSLGLSSYHKNTDFGGGGYPGRQHSGVRDEGEEGAIPRKKLRLTKDQYVVLEDIFKNHANLTPNQKQALAKQLNLRPRQVDVWFQNRRARIKLKQTEAECELLKKCCERLTEENKRLRKELLELKLAGAGAPATTPPAVHITPCLRQPPSLYALLATSTSVTNHLKCSSPIVLESPPRTRPCNPQPLVHQLVLS